MRLPSCLTGPLLAGLMFLFSGCESLPTRIPDGGLEPLIIERVEPDTILPGSWIMVHGSGFVPPATGALNLELTRDGQTYSFLWESIDETLLAFRIDRSLFGSLGGPGSFQGLLIAEITDYATGAHLLAEAPVSWTLEETLRPRLDSFTPAASGQAVYLGELVQAGGSGFLLEGEGITEIELVGEFTPPGSPDATAWSGSCALGRKSRELMEGGFPAELLGILPGRFQGQVAVVNRHHDGTEVAGSGLSNVTIDLGPTALLFLEPLEAGRGQWIDFGGRGFVGGAATTIVEVVGSFSSTSGEVTHFPESGPLILAPEIVSGEVMRHVLRVTQGRDGTLQGLGAQAGILRGTATPLQYFGSQASVGESLPGEFTVSIRPPKQVVFVKFLPGFTDALREFGLRNLESPIRERIFEVIRRDYTGINLEFRADRPEDFADYSVIEVGGVDPNGMGLLGLDNTMNKDTENLHMDDVVGGVSLTETGFPAYGGVFLSSYLAFSPSHPYPLTIADPIFDEIFSPFCPSLGGTPATAEEYPSGERGPTIEVAYRALANMLGNTVTHEIGHTLGLAVGPSTQMHNAYPGDNQIMDSGVDREFEERAEINGRGPAVFTDKNREYLERILPR